MNTNINPQDLPHIPDADVLTQLANQFFSTLPNDQPSPNFGEGLSPRTSPPANGYEHLTSQNQTFNVAQPQTSLFDPHFTNDVKFPSASGLGVSSSAFPNSTILQGGDLGLSSQLPSNTLSNSSHEGITPSVLPNNPSNSVVNQHNGVNINDPQTSHRDPHFANGQVPKSVAGSGVSLSAQNRENLYRASEPNAPLPDPNYAGAGKAPPSVAGSGISPSAIEQHNAVNIDNPQTSLRDPHFANGQVSKSATSGHSNANHSSYNETTSFESELKEALAAINGTLNNPLSAKQLPFSPTGFNQLDESNFYFLTGKFPLPSVKNNTAQDLPTHKTGHLTGFRPPFDANLVKKDFPILQERVNGKPLIWLDNAATTQKPKQVIDRISYFYEHENSNIHRAAHELAARATDAYEGARERVRLFLNAASTNEIIFVRGTTEGINLIAQSWGDQNLKAGDEIVVSHLEHHANIVPWQLLAAKKGLKLRVIPVDDDGQIRLDEYSKLLGPKTRLVSFTQVSNALGTITPAKIMIEMAHQVGAKVLLDGAQSVSHMRVDVQELNPDWFVFSGHKVFGPTGIGAVYGKEDLLNQTRPWQGGGNMIADVTFEHTKYHNAPTRFEAGTGNIADAVGLGAAIDYVLKFGMDAIGQYEHFLLEYATSLLKQVPGLRLIGTAHEKASVLSFILKGYTNDEVGQALNQEGIAVRTGHHCAQPILRRFGLESTVRPSLAFYNTCADVDTLVEVLHRLSSQKK